MSYLLRGKRGGLLAFLLITALVVGGLGWVAAAALRLEQAQLHAQAQQELDGQVQFALSLLDGRIRPALSKEDSRPYNHYSAIFAPPFAMSNDGKVWRPGSVLEPSPLLNSELPDWLLLHFQVDEESGWASPQVLSPTLRQRLDSPEFRAQLGNVTERRAAVLKELDAQVSPRQLLATIREHGARATLREKTLLPGPGDTNEPQPTGPPVGQMIQGGVGQVQANPTAAYNQFADRGFQRRMELQSKVAAENIAPMQKAELDVANSNTGRNGFEWLYRDDTRSKKSAPVDVQLSPLVPLWLRIAEAPDRLVAVRLVRIGEREFCQGIVLDWPAVQSLLLDEVSYEFPEAKLSCVREVPPAQPERTLRSMTALPVQFDPGRGPVVADAGWTPLRVGLALAGMAALVALGAVGLGGWSLLDLSERRVRFVSAVTHELRTPLTTLRLYLDMLTGGMVREEQQRTEYLHTLHAEAERLNRLIRNVLDFSRLENQQPRLSLRRVAVVELLDRLQAEWIKTCEVTGKELIVENSLAADAALDTDQELVLQIVGNLIDNACKYSKEATDKRVWLRVGPAERRRIAFEVEDRGPGVAGAERRIIFQPFRRGQQVPVTGGGVGLGLALAQRWARLLGGSLDLQPVSVGACFRLELPA